METRIIREEQVEAFRASLREEERAGATAEKYLCAVRQFAAWMGGGCVTRDAVAQWKERLLGQGCAPSTVNGKLTALDRFFDLLGWGECKAKHLRLQRRLFRDDSRELTKREYQRLVAAAESREKQGLGLLMEAICGTGVRVSEVRYITVEAARLGRAEVAMKGKIRTILIPGKLRRKLLNYAKRRGITKGEIFLSSRGTPLDRRRIWLQMKQLCAIAGVAASKVFPHNLRHLFACTFYRVCRDVAKLADVLGHSSIETTRLYLLTSGTEHIHTLERMRLVT